MSLLLDALKEAEARKREAAPVVPAAPEGGPNFESDGALALADDYVPASAPATGLPPGGRSGSSTPLGAPEPFHDPLPAASGTPAQARMSPATPAAPLTAAAADALLSTRAARTTTLAAGQAAAAVAPSSGTAAAPPAPAVVPPVAGPSSRTSAPPAAQAAAASTPPRRPLRALVIAAATLALLLVAFVVYDQFIDVATPVPPALPPQPVLTVPAAPAVPGDVGSADVAATSTGASAPASAVRSRGEGSADFVFRPTGPAPTAARRVDPMTGGKARRVTPADESSRDAGDGRRTALATENSGVQISVSREPAPLEAAWAALQSGALARAESLYRGVLDSEPGQVDAQLGLAVIAQARGDDAAARRGFARVLESVPDHPRAWAGLAELASEGDAGTIESRLRQLLADRASAPLHFALGNLLARQQRWSDAQAEYFAAASLEPQAADYAFNVAVALERLDKPAAALPWYDKALAMAARGRAVRFDTAAVRARVSQLRAAPP